MRKTKKIMGMNVILEVPGASKADLESIFEYFRRIDDRFSPFKSTSEVSAINNSLAGPNKFSKEMIEVLNLAEKTKQETNGFFDVYHEDKFDPSGIVKGWAINQAARLLKQKGFKSFYVEAGGDIEVAGNNENGVPWIIGIRHPFEKGQVVKRVKLSNHGIATSGSYLLGQHIYNPHNNSPIRNIVSITVIGSDVYEADRMATASFAMGKEGIYFIEEKRGLEGYMIDDNGVATMTTGFERYTYD